jgi:hypothetical protein
MDTADRVELHELAALYGDLVDARDWDGLDRIFTPEAKFDLTDIKAGVIDGLEAIKKHLEHEPHHPVSHHITNIYVESLDGDRGRLRFRVIGMLADGRVGSGEYRDDVVRTSVGWRVSHQHFRLRRRPKPGAE